MKKFAMLFTVATVFAISCNNEAPATDPIEEAVEAVEETAVVVDSTATAVVDSAAAVATEATK